MIELAGIGKRFDGRPVLRDVHLSVPRGRRMALLGPSGSGKTTLLRIVAGLERPDEGSVRLDGRVVSGGHGMVAPFRRNLSLIFQGLSLWPNMTVKEHLTFVRPRSGDGGDGIDIGALLTRVGLDGVQGRFPHQLSGGERQRLAIARALVPLPKVLLMDEPFSHLDFDLKTEVIHLIDAFWRERAMTVLWVTHQLEDALYWCDEVAWLRKGAVEEKGSRETLRPLWEERFRAMGPGREAL
jgi:iron(III) transport system ATP-binding protein